MIQSPFTAVSDATAHVARPTGEATGGIERPSIAREMSGDGTATLTTKFFDNVATDDGRVTLKGPAAASEPGERAAPFADDTESRSPGRSARPERDVTRFRRLRLQVWQATRSLTGTRR